MANSRRGVLKINGNKGVLLDLKDSLRLLGGTEFVIPDAIIQKYGLVQGATITGTTKDGKVMDELTAICDLPPEKYQSREVYSQLTAIDPQERLNLGISGERSMIDLIAPIGKGTRGLLVSSPRAGKTTILMQMAKAIRMGNPDTQIIVFLIDERPEEVTHFKRSVDAEVIASNNDQSARDHIDLAELVLSHVQVSLECDKDVVVLVDSLTRMGRAFNQKGKSNGRIMSGGMQAGAMEIPRKFFGLARNIEGKGSVTIIATALVDTGSRMDELIFQEFKGTGNCEVILDRAIAESNIYPAINVTESGTRREEYLYSDEEFQKICGLRKVLTTANPRDRMPMMIDLVKKYKTNEELLKDMQAI